MILSHFKEESKTHKAGFLQTKKTTRAISKNICLNLECFFCIQSAD